MSAFLIWASAAYHSVNFILGLFLPISGLFLLIETYFHAASRDLSWRAWAGRDAGSFHRCTVLDIKDTKLIKLVVYLIVESSLQKDQWLHRNPMKLPHGGPGTSNMWQLREAVLVPVQGETTKRSEQSIMIWAVDIRYDTNPNSDSWPPPLPQH